MSKKLSLDQEWRFHLGEESNADYMGHDDRAWRSVSLPHDWAVEQPFDCQYASGTGYLPGGIGWYRKHFFLDAKDLDKRIRILFEGVYKHALVWINSYYLGRHAYGFTSFSFDISDFVREGENVLAVRVEHQDVADCRWYTGSGITRHVALEINDAKGFAEHGIYLRTCEADNDKAEICIDYVTNGADEVRFTLQGQHDECVFTEQKGKMGTARMWVKHPMLWSPDHPYLYTLIAEAINDGKVTEKRQFKTGLRTFFFDPDHGFFLNQHSMKLKGVCVHHDAGCLGAAVPQEVWRHRLGKLKSMGCNAIRTAHNPPDPDLLDLCDEMGFLVMDEAFDEWEGIKNKWWQGHNVYPPKHYGYAEDFPEWHERDLKSMVLRDRNHPSVILWSIGNEVDYPNDPYATQLYAEATGNNDANKPLSERLYDPCRPDARRLATVARELVSIVHQLDSERPVLSALSFPELSNRTGLADELDMSGYNYREQYYEEDHRKYPNRVILGSENSHEPEAWRYVRDREYISGQFLWTGIDFLGECPGWPSRISQAGALNLAGFEKPLFYHRQAMWGQTPVVKLAVGSASQDQGAWKEDFLWKGQKDELRRVSCYTNQSEAELFLNGVSCGRKTLSDADMGRITWDVLFEEGTLKVVAGGLQDTLSTPRKATKLQLVADRKRMDADGSSTCRVEIYLKSEDDVPAADEIVHVQIWGDGRILGIENGCHDDLTPYFEHYRSTLRGRAVTYVRAGKLPGDMIVRAWTDGGLMTQEVITIE